jgi:hypothetical protein
VEAAATRSADAIEPHLGGDELWLESGANVYRSAGSVGIGGVPSYRLDVGVGGSAPEFIRVRSLTHSGIRLDGDVGSSGSGNAFVRFSLYGDLLKAIVGRTFNSGVAPDGTAYTGVVNYSLFLGTMDIYGALQFGTNGAVRMTINTAGNIGIGAAPVANTMLHVEAAGTNAGPWMTLAGGGSIFQNTALRLWDLGTGANNQVDLEFAASNAGTVALLGRIRGQNPAANVSTGGRLILEATSNAAGTFNANQVSLENNGNVDMLAGRLRVTDDIQGNRFVAVGNTARYVNPSDAATSMDLQGAWFAGRATARATGNGGQSRSIQLRHFTNNSSTAQIIFQTTDWEIHRTGLHTFKIRSRTTNQKTFWYQIGVATPVQGENATAAVDVATMDATGAKRINIVVGTPYSAGDFVDLHLHRYGTDSWFNGYIITTEVN